MTRRNIRVSEETRDLVRGIHPHIKKKIRSALEEILKNPHAGKALRAELKGLWSYRVGRLRIIYRWDTSKVEIVTIGQRRIIYEETLRLIQSE